ncbi:VOC family protein [Cytobacillus oceanisediminis]|uniref:VOC family protein n=1 Tax=Cytobacillus oceanisediminis TaxID=665099 RepID=UPI0020422872|nr:VOC family protein [Cytobacillus oceanisediminis]MCM3393174.1 VOC family protein [Cytobacillus oceanisediminis]
MKFRWDGGFIMVSWDKFEEGVEWYTKHMGWTCLDQVITPVGKKAFLKMPRLGVVTLKSFESDMEHFKADNSFEGNMRMGFEITNLGETLNYFDREGIKVTELKTLPDGQVSFDITGFENARLTAVYNKSIEGEFLTSRITGFSDVNVRIGVSDIDKAIRWYKEYLGVKLVKQYNDDFAHLHIEDAYDWMQLSEVFYDNIWLEKIEHSDFIKANPAVRNYFDIRPEEFNDTYNHLKLKGVELSEVAGDPQKGWAGFHFFDLDGNRINIWSYPA